MLHPRFWWHIRMNINRILLINPHHLLARDLLVKLSTIIIALTLLLKERQRHLRACAWVSRSTSLLKQIKLKWMRKTQPARVPYRRTPSAKLNALKACSFRDACAPCAPCAPHSFVTYPVETFPVLDTSVSWWKDSRVSTSIRIRYPARSSIYDSCSSG